MMKFVIIRVVNGFVQRLLLFNSVKYFTLTTLAVFQNLSPFFTTFLGCIILDEDVSLLDFTTIFMGFSAVMSITYGMLRRKPAALEELKDSNEFARHDHMSVLNMCGLISVPILLAS